MRSGLALLFFVLASLTVGGLHASADPASITATDGSAATIRQQVAFLDQAGQMAAGQSSSDKLRSFAKREAEHQGIVFAELRAQNELVAMAAANAKDVGRFGMSLPASPDVILTGRSAAIDTSSATPQATTPSVVSPGVVVMPRLAALNGAAFDRLYKATQIATLQDLAAAYKAYETDGRDPALRALASRELPVIAAHLQEISSL